MPNVVSMVAKEEGFRAEPYYCSKGYPTIGYGLRIGPKGADLALYTFTISKEAASADLKAKLIEYADQARGLFAHGVFDNLTEPRQSIIQSMIYQMGRSGVSGFRRFIAAVNSGDYEAAKSEMLDSKWAREDSPERAARHAWQMATGRWHRYYL
ncbi:MAG: glycoside hydrolase family protein [Rickettsiales bacterium]